MSILQCERKGCDNIMCERHSDIYGDLCNECFEELVNLGPEASIDKFMETERRGDASTRRLAAEARFNIEFPLS